MKTIQQLIDSCSISLNSLKDLLPIEQYKRRLSEIDELVTYGDLWSDPKSATKLMKERQRLFSLINSFNDFMEKYSFYKECYDLMPGDTSELIAELSELEVNLSSFEFNQMMCGPDDDNPAIFTITAGSGGLEAANWTSMLLRMYLRYLSNNKLTTEILYMKESDEHSDICIDSVSIRVEGPYAYGLLKGESGIHRLIRNSPFNSGDARHTSFAAVSVLPDIEDTIDIKIDEKDIDIIAQTAGGAGGQNQNRRHSAIRLRHLPTGINILVRTERDFHRNKATAFKMLKARLYDLELKKQNEDKQEILSQQSEAAFGHQIRTYTVTPYSLVKDHRTDYETSQINSVLDGDIQGFISSYLKFNSK